MNLSIDRFTLARRLAVAVLAGAMTGIAPAAHASTLKTLYNFCTQANCADGSLPLAGLARDAAGNLYGTTEIGGKHNDGAVFGLMRNGDAWTYKVLHSFCYACGDGAFPTSRLIVDGVGNLYGTVESDGNLPDCGFAFRLSPAGRKWTLTHLHDFCTGTGDGAQPVTRLTYAGQGAGALYDGASPLYGTTTRGGPTDRGAVYELTSTNGKWKERVIYSFCPNGGTGCPDGWQPNGELVIDSAGNLYGNTFLGGAAGDGAVFQLARRGSGWQQSVIYSFCSIEDCSDGDLPAGALTMDTAGTLFGTTTNDSGEGGTVYRLTRKGGGLEGDGAAHLLHRRQLHRRLPAGCRAYARQQWRSFRHQ